jgi:cell division protein FtsB
MKLVELITASVLLALLCAACATLLHSQMQLLNDVTTRVAEGETLRAARSVLTAELRDLVNTDVHAIAGDSVALRVFRGWGVTCSTANGVSAVRFHGLRDLDASKDSLLVVGAEQAWAFTGGNDAGVCGASEHSINVRTASPLSRGSILMFFETGAYHLANSALRYRRGSEGRQPITDELLDDRASMLVREAAALRIQLSTHHRMSSRTRVLLR